MKLGILTPNFGRLIVFLSNILYANLPNRIGTIDQIVSKQRIFWIHMDSHRYPFISSILKNYIRTVPTIWIFVYRIITKFPRLLGHFSISQDALNEFTPSAWSGTSEVFSLLPELSPSTSLQTSLIHHGIEINNFVILHTRDSDWEEDVGLSYDYIKTQEFRNSNSTDFRTFALNYLSMGYTVVRTGRSNSQLFQSFVPGFFDYSCSSFANDADDFFLWNSCKFAVVTLNGGCNVGFLLQKRILIWDYSESISTLSDLLSLYPENFIHLVPHEQLERMEESTRNTQLTVIAQHFSQFCSGKQEVLVPFTKQKSLRILKFD